MEEHTMHATQRSRTSISALALGGLVTGAILLTAMSVLLPVFPATARMILVADANGDSAAKRTALFAKPGPLVHYTFAAISADKQVKDVTGNGFDATVNGTGTARTEAGPHGGALVLDGQSFLVAAQPELLQMTSFTLSAWIKTDEITGRYGILAKRTANMASPFVLAINNGGLEFDATDVDNAWSLNVNSDPVLTSNQWTHVAAVMSAGKSVILYANGKKVASVDSQKSVALNDEPLTIGFEAWGGPDLSKGGDSGPVYLRGSIADVQVFPRDLSPAEIVKLAAQ